MNFAKFFRTPFSQTTYGRLFLAFPKFLNKNSKRPILKKSFWKEKKQKKVFGISVSCILSRNLDKAFWLLFCVPYIVTFKWVSLSIFSWTQSSLILEIKGKMNFNNSLWITIFKIFQICTKHARSERIST